MKTDQASSLFLIAFGGLVTIFASRLGIGSLKHIGPGFISFWAAVALCGLGAVVFVKSTIASGKEEQSRVSQLWIGVNWKKPVFVVLLIVAYILLNERIGFILSSTLLLAALFLTTGPVKVGRDLAIAVLSSLLIFILFDIWLDVLLPGRIIERLLTNLKRLIV